MMRELMVKNRTIRRFDRSKAVTGEDIREILSLARLCASAANLQRIRYISLVGESAADAFSSITLGGYLPPESRPDRSVAPTAYIVILAPGENPDVNLSIDVGIAAEAITLVAAERGIGACMIRNFKARSFMPSDNSAGLNPVLVLALGYPAEVAETIDIQPTDSIKYYKNSDGVNCVPKRMLEELLIEEKC